RGRSRPGPTRKQVARIPSPANMVQRAWEGWCREWVDASFGCRLECVAPCFAFEYNLTRLSCDPNCELRHRFGRMDAQNLGGRRDGIVDEHRSRELPILAEKHSSRS